MSKTLEALIMANRKPIRAAFELKQLQTFLYPFLSFLYHLVYSMLNLSYWFMCNKQMLFERKLLDTLPCAIKRNFYCHKENGSDYLIKKFWLPYFKRLFLKQEESNPLTRAHTYNRSYALSNKSFVNPLRTSKYLWSDSIFLSGKRVQMP